MSGVAWRGCASARATLPAISLLRVGADQRAEPGQHVGAVLPRPAELVQVIAPLHGHQAAGLNACVVMTPNVSVVPDTL